MRILLLSSIDSVSVRIVRVPGYGLGLGFPGPRRIRTRKAVWRASSAAPNLPADSAVKTVSAFAAESASSISSLFENEGEDADVEKIGSEEDKK